MGSFTPFRTTLRVDYTFLICYYQDMGKRQILFSFVVFFFLVLGSAITVFFAQGYRIDFAKKEVTGTGIIAISSIPSGALVYLNNIPTSATNTSITGLSPGNYQIRLEKEGFTVYKKEVKVEKECVTGLEALLVRSAPELKPLTYTQVLRPLLSPDEQKIVFSSTQNGTSGLWLLELTERPFNLPQRSTLLLKDTKKEKYSEETPLWSLDGKSILVGQNLPAQAGLFDLTTKTLTKEVDVEVLKSSWQAEEKETYEKLLEGFSEEIREKILSLKNPIWSPDNTKVIYEKEDAIFVFNLTPKDLRKKEPEEYKTYQKLKDKFSKTFWYPDSQHILILEKESLESESGTIKIVEIDGENEMQVFTGTVISDYLFSYTNGSKIVILTTFNPESKQYNLYSINLR